MIISRLRNLYDLSQSGNEFLHFKNPYEILIATILSAQTTDRTVNLVTQELFKRYPDIASLAKADPAEVEIIIHRTGFYHAKTKNIIATSQMVVLEYGGVVPDRMEDLILLPGVGRKTANIVLSHAFSKIVGIAVDTHVRRVSMRLGLTSQSDPNRIETDLKRIFLPDTWAEINGLFILHGRKVCNARKPSCTLCVLADMCQYAAIYSPGQCE